MEFITEVPSGVKTEVEYIAATVPVRVYYDHEGNALLLGEDNSYVVSVRKVSDRWVTTETAYLINKPVEGARPWLPDDGDKGFEPGFTT